MTESESATYSSQRCGIPDFRLLHYNDVYHVEPGSQEPVGGLARFTALCRHYRDDISFRGHPSLLTLFSGDAFNPSLESSVTKGYHMVPALNGIGTDVACVGNHDLDFGVAKFEELAQQCSFPWLLANVLDPALGPEVPLGRARKTLMIESSNGLKVGVIGLVEREWLDTINALPPNLVYKSVSATAADLGPQLRAQGADIVIALTHQREPNDKKLASQTPPGTIDLILGGHDHFYGHDIVNGTHILRSGTDFKNLSYIEVWRNPDDKTKWDFTITRRNIVRSLPSDGNAAALVAKLSSRLRTKLEKPIGYTASPLDARFSTVRLKESNIGNFVCDIMRLYYGADCAIMAGGTIRGDQIYPPGVLRLKDIMNCFPFEDPVVVLRVEGAAIRSALENAVSTYPAQEGRFPQVSNINMTFDAALPPGSRMTKISVNSKPLQDQKQYTLATRDYMARGKDGFDALRYSSAGGTAETLVDEESGILISMLLRQYFTSMQVTATLGKGVSPTAVDQNEDRGQILQEDGGNDRDHVDRHWDTVHYALHDKHPVKPACSPAVATTTGPSADDTDEDEPSDDDAETSKHSFACERRLFLARHVTRHWRKVAGIGRQPEVAHDEHDTSGISWAAAVAPQVEGRILIEHEHIFADARN